MVSEQRPLSSVERAYLDAIVAAPKDDGPRLVYADWLLREGQQLHGELITVQCALAQHGEDAQQASLRAREAQLLAAPALAWLAPFMKLAARTFGGSMRPQRGFIDTRTMVSRAPELLAAHRGLERYAPFVERMRLLACPSAEFEQLIDAGALTRIARLELHDTPKTGPRPTTSLRAPLPVLTKLELRQVALPTAFAEQLFARPMPTLEELTLDECLMDAGSLPALIAHAPPRLRRLKMSRCMGSGSLHVLADLHLDELRISGPSIPYGVANHLRRAIRRCVLPPAYLPQPVG